MAKRPKFETPLEHQLYAAVMSAYAADRHLTEYALAKKAGITQPILGRFIAGTRTLSLKSAGKLAKALDLRLAKNNSENN